MKRRASAIAFIGLVGGLVVGAAPGFAADSQLIAAAKKEGQVTWYTTQIVDQFVRPAAKAFEKTYGIKVNYVRADSNAVALRILNEGRAGRMQADVFDGTAAVAGLEKQHLVLKWEPKRAAKWPANLHDPNGYWTATNLYVLTPGYNTHLVPKNAVPKNWNDLLNPRWKGKMVWNSNPTASGGPGFVGLVLKQLGQKKGMAYLTKLARQNITGMRAAARQVLDQVIAGEYAIALQIFNNHTVISAAQGAPSAWIPMNPAMGLLSVISVTKGAPHPAAGKLLVDFLTSRAGQEIYRKANYLPIDPRIPPIHKSLRPDGKKFKAIYFSPEEIQTDMPKWNAVFQRLFR